MYSSIDDRSPTLEFWLQTNGHRTCILLGFTRFTKSFIEQTRTSFFLTSNGLEYVHLLVMELENPIFGFERSNFEHILTHHQCSFHGLGLRMTHFRTLESTHLDRGQLGPRTSSSGRPQLVATTCAASGHNRAPATTLHHQATSTPLGSPCVEHQDTLFESETRAHTYKSLIQGVDDHQLRTLKHSSSSDSK